VLFDDQFNMVSSNSGNRQVQASPGALQTLAVSAMTIKSTGFIYIYVSNESGQDVYFDNLVVNHTSGPLLEETHYYPFGLTMAGISSHALLKLDNRYKYNGKELQSEEFADGNGLEEYDYGARFYDPAVGRFTSMDPLSEKMRRHSPYNYAFDNPIRFIDIDGMSPGDFYNKNGDHLGSDGNADQKKYVVADEQEAKQVAQTDKEKGTTQVSNLKSAVGLPSDKVLAAALDVLKRATSNGGQKEEASIVNRNGYVAESVTGPEPTIENGVQTAPDVLPKVWPGDPASAVQATIHSHPVKPLVDGDRVYGQSANNPSQQDLTTFSQFNLNIIVGPLGVLENVTKNERGEIQGTYRPNGVVLYNSNGKEQVSLTEKAVNKIVSH
ncbi:RHS repeat-associated core domain-containing protein, partial [Chitinophaga costaii]